MRALPLGWLCLPLGCVTFLLLPLIDRLRRKPAVSTIPTVIPDEYNLAVNKTIGNCKTRQRIRYRPCFADDDHGYWTGGAVSYDSVAPFSSLPTHSVHGLQNFRRFSVASSTSREKWPPWLAAVFAWGWPYHSLLKSAWMVFWALAYKK